MAFIFEVFREHRGTCSRCEWKAEAVTTQEGMQLLAVLHVLVCHPDLYEKTTGKSAEVGAYDYRESLADPLVVNAARYGTEG